MNENLEYSSKSYCSNVNNDYDLLFDELIKCSGQTSCKTREFSKNLVDNAGIIINIWKLDGTLIKFNKYAEKVTGFSANEVLGEKWKRTIADPEIEVCVIDYFKAIKNGEVSLEADSEGKLICKDGRYLDVIWSNYLILNKNDTIEFVVSMGMNITEHKLAVDVIKKLAYYDGLTGLPNRVLIEDKTCAELLKAKQNKSKLAFIYMDLDNFKTINDTLGHVAGNELLKIIGNLIRNTINGFENVARLGGDEFVLLLPEVNSVEEVRDFGNTIINLFNKPLIISNKEFHLTASVGIAIYPDDGRDFNTLMKSADIAMYYAKEQGKNRCEFFTKEMNARVLERLDLENSLRVAIRNNEFKVFYQPQINIETGKIDGMEALVRWVHPEESIISPIRFIPLAEDNGLIIPIGNIVLLSACRQNKLWQEAGYTPLRVAVNLSAKQFEQENLVEIIKSVLEETGLEPQWLELEITESILMKNLDFSIGMLNKLRSMGIHVSLDDFGTGYSSLNYLKILPIDTLKIDKSFVDNITVDAKDEIIAKAIIELAHKMDLDIIAEGVEYSEQFNFLKKYKCDKVQGFLFSKPVPGEEFELLLRESKTFIK